MQWLYREWHLSLWAGIEFYYGFLAIIQSLHNRKLDPAGDRWEYMYIPIRRYQAMRNSSKLRLSMVERLYLAELVRLELTSLN